MELLQAQRGDHPGLPRPTRRRAVSSTRFHPTTSQSRSSTDAGVSSRPRFIRLCHRYHRIRHHGPAAAGRRRPA
ncbi:hypothetical protein BKN46_26030, partial [Pseudomonas aeruginosa]